MNTQLSIQPAGTAFAPFDHRSFFSAHGYDIPLGTQWLDNGTVEIALPPGTEATHKDDRAGNTRILYRDIAASSDD